VHHAYEHTPYYRRLFQELGLQPSAIQEAGDLTKIPLLTKDIAREQRENLLAQPLPRAYGRTRISPTGGSSGDPFNFVQDDRSWAVSIASIERGYAMAGWVPGDPVAIVWGRHVDLIEHRSGRQRLVDAGINQLFLDSYGVTQEELAEYAEQIRAFRPRLLVGFSASLVALAHVIRDRHIEGIRPGAIVTTAETLFPAQRRLLETTFECRVFDRYGAAEAAALAHECAAHAGLHIFSDLHVVEVLTDEGLASAERPGHMVVTTLDNYAMPLLRYAIGDTATLSSGGCRCGLPFPLLASLDGRVTDIITSPSGRILHGLLLSDLLLSVPGIRRYQIIQETMEDLSIKLVVMGDVDAPALESKIRTMIHAHADPAFRVKVHLVDAIDHSASGKYQSIISNVSKRRVGGEPA